MIWRVSSRFCDYFRKTRNEISVASPALWLQSVHLIFHFHFQAFYLHALSFCVAWMHIGVECTGVAVQKMATGIVRKPQQSNTFGCRGGNLWTVDFVSHSPNAHISLNYRPSKFLCRSFFDIYSFCVSFYCRMQMERSSLKSGSNHCYWQPRENLFCFLETIFCLKRYFVRCKPYVWWSTVDRVKQFEWYGTGNDETRLSLYRFLPKEQRLITRSAIKSE